MQIIEKRMLLLNCSDMEMIWKCPSDDSPFKGHQHLLLRVLMCELFKTCLYNYVTTLLLQYNFNTFLYCVLYYILEEFIEGIATSRKIY